MSSHGQKSPAEMLGTPVQYLKGVGPQRAELLARLDLKFARDVLFFFPRAYQDMSELRAIGQLEEDQLCSVCGTVEEIDLRNTGTGRSMLGVLIRQGNEYLRALYFNQPFMRQKFDYGRKVLLAGTPKRNAFRWEMHHPRVELLGDDEDVPAGRILPVYPLTEGINQSQMRRIVQGVVETHTELVDEVFPDEYLDTHNLWPIRAALPQIHSPNDAACLEQARRRFIYQELLVLQIALAMRRHQLTGKRRAPPLEATAKIDARIRRLFPFELTAAQSQAITEIGADMVRPFPMNRLLQGDVGSGKTVVAEYAMLLTVAHGYQAVMMAPTEVLAQQHARTLARNLAESRVRIALLTGSLTPALRRATLESIAAGQVDLIVGTHAVLSADVQFAKLGLVVIDEQHKFGVRQRATLKQAALDPHYLVMTATPIPRTMSMTLFGDLDVSTLREAPPGRQPIHTYLGDGEKRARWWEFFGKKLREGRQGFVITPLVDSRTFDQGPTDDELDDELDDERGRESFSTHPPPDAESVQSKKTPDPFSAAVSSVESAFEELANGELEEFRLGLIHGRMSAADKEAAMEKFRRGETQVLVATSVVEVGVDVPNATVMTIENGERFGLAQLHQLRGRISRGSHPGYLCVFATPRNEESQRRLDSFVQTTDGFELAEIDFQLRGPGDLFGTKQHGLPPLRIADLTRDAALLDEARRDAQSLVASDPELHNTAYSRIRRMVQVRYGEALDLGDVG